MLSENFIEQDDTNEDASSSDNLVARGDSFLDEGEEAGLQSALPGVSDECWTQFVKALMTGTVSGVSQSNAVGVFEIMPRRLADLGEVQKLKRSRTSDNRAIYVAVFVPPMTSDRFLRSPKEQYRVFCRSISDYDQKLSNGEIEWDPEMSRSGALAILHRCGPNGLDTWRSGERFDRTQKIYDKVAGIF